MVDKPAPALVINNDRVPALNCAYKSAADNGGAPSCSDSASATDEADDKRSVEESPRGGCPTPTPPSTDVRRLRLLPARPPADPAGPPPTTPPPPITAPLAASTAASRRAFSSARESRAAASKSPKKEAAASRTGARTGTP